ncbi:condensation domain-containing protein [Streptomyces sp. NPDC001941]|uniref:condensation domain-containing protein n=1 Tax=Streptomyces sp. NPDC001941 TaxID=3154659 RepID=UPI00331BBC55
MAGTTREQHGVPTARHTGHRPASPGERQFWFAEQIAPGAVALRAVGHLRIEGPVDHAVLCRALTAVHHRHEALRTAYVLRDGEVVRQVLDGPERTEPMELPPGTTFTEAAGRLLTPDAFDIAAGRVHRVAVATGPAGADLYLGVHHISFDGLSLEAFATELAAAYARAADGTAPEPAPVRRADPDVLPGPQREELVAYWRTALDGAPDLPARGPAPTHRDVIRAPAAEHRATWPAALWSATRDRARRHACSPYALLLTAYGRALAEETGADDFCVGTAIAQRSASNAEEIGCLINTVPLRLRDPHGPDAVDRFWNTAIDAMAHAGLPTDEIVRECRGRPGRRMPLFQTLFGFQNWQRTEHAAGPVRMWTVPVRPVGCAAELQVQVAENAAQELEVTLQAPADGAWAPHLERLLAGYRHQLDTLATREGTP